MEKIKDFVAISIKFAESREGKDTTAKYFPIQIGLAKFKDGVLQSGTYATNIKPPIDGRWESKGREHMTWRDCESSRTLDEVYPELIAFIGNFPLVSFGSTNIHKPIKDGCDYYGLPNPIQKESTIDLSNDLNKYKYPLGRNEDFSALANWVMMFGLDKQEWTPHYAPHDAEMLGELYLHLHQYNLDDILEKKPANKGVYKAKGVCLEEELIGAPIAEEEVEFPENPLNRKNVYLTGFSKEQKNSTHLKLRMLGAGRLKSDTKDMDILVTTPKYMAQYGGKSNSKIVKAIELNKVVMSVKELAEILKDYGLYEGELDDLFVGG